VQVSWGTKGSDKADPLPSVSSSKGKDAAPVVEDTTKMQEDVDAAFKDTVTRALTKVETKEVVEKPTPDDQNKTFRTRLVAFWMLSNASLAVAIENINGLPSRDLARNEDRLREKQNFYFGVILYSTFGLAAVRFSGVRLLCAHFSACVTLMCVLPVPLLLLQAESLQVLPQELSMSPLELIYNLCCIAGQ
jgi:chitin synthase